MMMMIFYSQARSIVDRPLPHLCDRQGAALAIQQDEIPPPLISVVVFGGGSGGASSELMCSLCGSCGSGRNEGRIGSDFERL